MPSDPKQPSALPVLVVVGPTASGKSTCAARLGSLFGGEVVSADSVQVYRHFDIGAGKPSLEELALCPHHLLDISEATSPIDANQWATLADERISEIRERGHLPIVCGGTFLWVRALLYGLAEAPEGDAALRARHQAFAEERGRPALHARLAEVDPAMAERLHPNDLVRVSRALEVYELTQTKLSTLQAEHGFRTPRYDFRLLGIDWPRDAYDERVGRRVQAMLDQGLVQEVTRLLERGLGATRAMESVGYRQVRDALADGPSGSSRLDTAALAQEIVRVTRIFARRQRTWLRDEPVTWLPAEALEEPDQALRERVAPLLGRASTDP